jgi:hypothetical protein
VGWGSRRAFPASRDTMASDRRPWSFTKSVGRPADPNLRDARSAHTDYGGWSEVLSEGEQ